MGLLSQPTNVVLSHGNRLPTSPLRLVPPRGFRKQLAGCPLGPNDFPLCTWHAKRVRNNALMVS